MVMTYHSRHTETPETAQGPQFRVIRGMVARKVFYSAGDDIAWLSGRFVRYGTIREVREYSGKRGPSYQALVRAGHGTELVPLARVTPAAWGGRVA